MPRLQIPIAGPTYKSRSSTVSNQVTKNLYLEPSSPPSLQSTPGLVSFATTTDGVDRGMGKFNGVLYKVTRNALYSIASDGTSTYIGFIEGQGRCQLIDSIQNLVIVTGTSKPYAYDGTTLTQGTDSDLPNASSVTYINNRVVYDGIDGQVVFPGLNDPLVVDSANILSQDVNPDDTLAVYAYKQQLFVFGEDFIVPYYNSGVGAPPYSAIQNSVISIGLGAINSVASNNSAMFFLGSDLRVYALAGLTAQAIDDQSIGNAIRGYSDAADAIGRCFSFNGQNFYYLTFPSSASWLYNERIGWTSMTYKDDEPHLMSDYVYLYDKHLAADRRNGNVYEMSLDAYTDNGESIRRQRDTVFVSGKEIGAPGHEVTMNELELIMETGVGGETSPQVLMSFSDDGGRTFSPEQPADFGEGGDFTIKQKWFDLGSAFERQFRFKVSDPVKVTFVSCNASIEVNHG